MIRQSYTVEEQGGAGRYLTLRESTRPDTIVVEVMNSGADGNPRHVQALHISRDDWEELRAKTGPYSSDFRWVSPPTTDAG